MNKYHPEQSESFLHAILEGFVDGVLVLTDEKQIVYANSTASAICNQLLQSETAELPHELQRVCAALIDSREFYPNYPISIESELITAQTTYRVRAQWLNLEVGQRPCLLLRLQDQNQSVQGLAIAEAQRWGLTPRETEVWMLRRAGCLRKDIAANLFIAVDTVKKHLKNIQAKRQAVVDEQGWQVQAS
jgi:DNA-binding CsgD family transcriptional regulator